LLRVSRVRLVAGNPVRRALVALDQRGMWRASQECDAVCCGLRVDASGGCERCERHRKKVLTGLRWFGILGEFA
jgi:hypothetical protein